MKFLSRLKAALVGDAKEEAPEPPPQSPPVSAPDPQAQPVPAAPAARAKAVRAPAPPSARPVSRFALKGTPSSQAEWLSQQIGRTAKAWVQIAQTRGWKAVTPPGSVLDRSDVAALMLGFKIVSSAYQKHNDPPGPEVMRLLRAAITLPLHRAMQAQGGGEERVLQVEEHLKAAVMEITEVVAELKRQGNSKFAPFAPALVPAFGSGDFHEALQDLFKRLEAAMAMAAS